MNKQEILALLQAHKRELLDRFGVASVGLFGSYARDAARDDSDVDIAIEFVPERKNLGNFLGCKRYLEGLMSRPVDLGIESTLKPAVRESVRQDIHYA